MKTEIKDIREYNPEYRHDGTLVWKKIGEPVGKKGKHLRNKKQYPPISIDKIKAGNYTVNGKLLEDSRVLYQETKEMIPVYLDYFFNLIGGFEQYELAKELGLKKIPVQRINKMTKKQQAQLRNTVSHEKTANKVCPIKASDGTYIYLSINRYKKVKNAIRLANKMNLIVCMLPDFSFSLVDKNGKETIIGKDTGNPVCALNKYLKKYQAHLERKNKEIQLAATSY